MDILVHELCGVGNQLFQYAAGRYYAQKYHAGLVVLVDPDKGTSHGDPRPYQLSVFNLSAATRTATRVDQLLASRRKQLEFVTAPLRGVLGARKFIEPQPFVFHKNLPYRSLPNTLHLKDFWQAAGYAEVVRDQLRTELTFKVAPGEEDRKILDQIGSSACAISVHIRRGDYSKEVQPMLLPTSYYNQTWDSMLDKFGDVEFFVFSDDMDFARANLPSKGSRTYVSHNDSFSAFQDMRLMSACKHHIIANSTFSWWGAWLNAKPDKTVTAPKFWKNSAHSYFPDLFPSDWILIDNLVGRRP